MEDLLRSIERSGAAIVHGALPSSQVADIERQIAPYLKTARSAQQQYSVRLAGLLAKSQAVVPVIALPLVRTVCDRFLLPYCSRYQVCGMQVVESVPGLTPGSLHRDDLLWPFPGKRPPMVINFLFALTDCTFENGATEVVVGSHKARRDARKVKPGKEELDTFKEIREQELTSAIMPSGSVLILLGGTIHRRGGNSSLRHKRRLLAISFNLGWLRQEENFYLSVPPEVVDGLPALVQELIGYAIHDPYLGQTGIQ